MKNQLPHPPHAICSYHRQAISIYITTRSNSGWQKSCRVGGHRSSRSSKKKISHSSVHARMPCQIQTHHIVDVHYTYHAPCTTSRVSQAPREAGEVPTNRRGANRRYVDTTAEQPGDCAASDTKAGRITTASSTHHWQQVHACTHRATHNMQHAALTRQQQHALPLLAYRPHRSVPHEEMETKRRAHGPQPKLDSTGGDSQTSLKKDGAAPARVAAPLGLGWDGGKNQGRRRLAKTQCWP